jgi:hypothetical protein
MLAAAAKLASAVVRGTVPRNSPRNIFPLTFAIGAHNLGSVAGELISRERALDAIGDPYLALLTECHNVGWDDWLTIRATRAGASLSKSARARIVYDGAVRHAESVFPAVMCGKKHGLLVVDFAAALARFKLLQPDLTPRGIPTGQSELFEAQGQMEQTTLWPRPPMLIVGYILDPLGTQIVRQVLVLRRSGEVLWDHDLRQARDAESRGAVSVMPTPPRPPAPADVHSGRPDVEVVKEAE